MDGKWTISDNCIIHHVGNITQRKIMRNVKPGKFINRIDIILESNEAMTLNLKDLYSDKVHITDAIRSSRSKFMEWFYAYQMQSSKDKTKEQTDKTEPTEVLAVNKSKKNVTVDITEESLAVDKSDENLSVDRTEDSLATDNNEASLNVDRAETSLAVDSDDESLAIDRTEKSFGAVDKGVLKKLLFGSQIPVHISNLISPSNDSLVRSLDNTHVETIYSNLKRAHGHYTTLIGVLKTNVENADTLQHPHAAEIEVIGGNHTRAALQKLQLEGHIEENYCVLVNVYRELTIAQTLHLGFMHNEMHESSRKMSFQEKVILFRKLKHGVKVDGKNPRKGTMMWRGRVATVINKTKTEIKNSYRVHLNLASQEEEVWECLEKVFEACKGGRIKGIKTQGEFSQYDFLHFSKLKNVEERKKLLMDLADGNIDIEEFREITKGSRTHRVQKSKQNNDSDKETEESETMGNEKQLQIEEMIAQGGDNVEQNEEPRNLKGTTELMIEVDDLREKLKIANGENKTMKEKLTLNAKLLSEQEKEIERLKRKTQEQDREILHLKKSEEIYRIELRREEERRAIAEDAAGRARARLLEKAVNKKPDQTNSKQANEQQKPLQKRKIIAKRHWEDESSKCDGQKKLKQKNDSNEEIIEKQCGIVKYGEDIYFGQFETPENFIFCKSPVAKVCIEGKTYKKTETGKAKAKDLNFRDCQQVSANDIVSKFKGSVDSKGKLKLFLTEKEFEIALDTFLNSN